MRHVVMFSGGVGSWAAAKRVAERHGTKDLVLLFADTLMEDEDLYRFLPEAAANVGGELVRLCEGRTPWQVFHDERWIGNAHIAPCSSRLKQRPADAWLAANCDPAEATVYVGIDWTEEHRYTRLRDKRLPWHYEAPMCEPPYRSKHGMLDWLRIEGIEPPRLYSLGFAHNNCNGGCVKGGIGHWARLLSVFPDRYAQYETAERDLLAYLGRSDIAVLRDRRGGQARPLTLRGLRERIEAGHQPDLFDIGGCGCFVDVADEEVLP